MKVVIYTQNNCQFTPQEKNYLASKGVTFEERNVETNKGYLDEMMKLGSNFAGTPVTQIVKDDGSSTVLKGFTQTEFDAALGGSPVAAANADMTMPQAPVDQPVAPATSDVAPVASDAMPAAPEPTTPPTPEATADKAVQTANNPLDAILADLQQKVSATTPTVQSANADMTMPAAPVDQPVTPPTPEPAPVPSPEPTPVPAVDMPTPATSDVAPSADLPNVPDFPAK